MKKKKPKVKKTKKLFKYEIPDLEKYIGREVVINGNKITIDQIVGNVGLTLGRAPKDQRPQYLEINGQHNISMLRFFAQMEGATDITEEQFKQFEDTEFWAEASKPDEEKIEADTKKLVDQIMRDGKNG